jgi:hypothetical protein
MAVAIGKACTKVAGVAEADPVLLMLKLSMYSRLLLLVAL